MPGMQQIIRVAGKHKQAGAKVNESRGTVCLVQSGKFASSTGTPANSCRGLVGDDDVGSGRIASAGISIGIGRHPRG